MLKQAGQRVQMSLRDVSRAICPYCRAEAGSAEELVGCERCGTVHHRECWDENGHRCAVRACEGGDELRRDAHAQWRQVEEHAAAEANPGTRARHLTRCQRRRVWSTTEEHHVMIEMIERARNRFAELARRFRANPDA